MAQAVRRSGHSKINGNVVAISSKYFYGYQLPAPEPVAAAVRAVFR